MKVKDWLTMLSKLDENDEVDFNDGAFEEYKTIELQLYHNGVKTKRLMVKMFK